MLLPENKQALTDILLYHVVSGKVMAADVTALTSATTVLGKDVTVKVDMGNVYINDAQVAQAVAQMWARIGVATEIDASTASTFFSRRNGFDRYARSAAGA